MISNNPFSAMAGTVFKVLGDTNHSSDFTCFANSFCYAVNSHHTPGLSCPAPECSHMTSLEGEAGRTEMRSHIGQQHPGMETVLFEAEIDQRVINLQHQESPEANRDPPANLGAPVADAGVLTGFFEALDTEHPPAPLPVVPAAIAVAGYVVCKTGQVAEKTITTVSKAVSAAVSQINSSKVSGASTPKVLQAGFSGLKQSLKHSLGNEGKVSPSSGPNTPKLQRHKPIATTSGYSQESRSITPNEMSPTTRAVLPEADKTTRYRPILPKYFSESVTVTVDDGKPYPCAFCSRSYSREADLKGHLTRKHSDVTVTF